MSRLDYSYTDPKGVEGQLLSTSDNMIDTGINKTGVSGPGTGQYLRYGRGVQTPSVSTLTASQNNDYVLAYSSATGNPIVGIAYYVAFYEKSYEPNGPYGIPPNRLFGVLKKGDILLWTETDVRKFDPVYCRVTVPASSSLVAGRWRNDADSGNAVLVPNSYFLETATGPGLVAVRVNFIESRPAS